jgi:predicted glycoside hydrolase/deacetylase ChbG (UPF0249 family)
MTDKRYLIVNADDFGLSPGVNRGVIKAHEQGIVTSASLMVRWPAVSEASAYCREHTDFGIGLHIDLGEWFYQDNNWEPLYEIVSIEDISMVSDEVYRQLENFRGLVGRDPDHIDSHQHVHQRDSVRSIFIDLANKLRVPLRNVSPEINYCGNFYGQTIEGSSLSNVISVEGLLKILKALPLGLTELVCHPGEGNDLDNIYNTERTQEMKTLCDPRVRAAVDIIGLELCSFGSHFRYLNKSEGKALEKERGLM